MVFIVVLWLIRLLPHRFDVDEAFPLLYCTPPKHLMIFIALFVWSERSHNSIHSCPVVN